MLLVACAAPRTVDVPAAPAFDLQAHRGGRALRPENTLSAFGHAIDLGVSTLELDIGLTADGVVVVSHDNALNPELTRDVQGAWLTARGPAIHQLTLAQLQRYDVGRIDPASAYGRQFAEPDAARRRAHPDAGAAVRAGARAQCHAAALQHRDQDRPDPRGRKRAP